MAINLYILCNICVCVCVSSYYQILHHEFAQKGYMCSIFDGKNIYFVCKDIKKTVIAKFFKGLNKYHEEDR